VPTDQLITRVAPPIEGINLDPGKRAELNDVLVAVSNEEKISLDTAFEAYRAAHARVSLDSEPTYGRVLDAMGARRTADVVKTLERAQGETSSDPVPGMHPLVEQVDREAKRYMLDHDEPDYLVALDAVEAAGR
jgi:hypothetical protein